MECLTGLRPGDGIQEVTQTLQAVTDPGRDLIVDLIFKKKFIVSDGSP